MATLKRLLLIVMALSVLNAALPPAPAWADGGTVQTEVTRKSVLSAAAPGDAPGVRGETGTRADEREYARREAAAPELAQFQGGFLGVILALAIVTLVALIVFLVVDWQGWCGHAHCHDEAPPPERHG